MDNTIWTAAQVKVIEDLGGGLRNQLNRIVKASNTLQEHADLLRRMESGANNELDKHRQRIEKVEESTARLKLCPHPVLRCFIADPCATGRDPAATAKLIAQTPRLAEVVKMLIGCQKPESTGVGTFCSECRVIAEKALRDAGVEP